MLGAETCSDGSVSAHWGLDGERGSSELQREMADPLAEEKLEEEERGGGRKQGCLHTHAVIFTTLSVSWELCRGRRARPGKAKLKFVGTKNFHSREDRGTGQGSGGVKCAGIGQKMGGGEEREGEGREAAI